MVNFLCLVLFSLQGSDERPVASFVAFGTNDAFAFRYVVANAILKFALRFKDDENAGVESRNILFRLAAAADPAGVRELATFVASSASELDPAYVKDNVSVANCNQVVPLWVCAFTAHCSCSLPGAPARHAYVDLVAGASRRR